MAGFASVGKYPKKHKCSEKFSHDYGSLLQLRICVSCVTGQSSTYSLTCLHSKSFCSSKKKKMWNHKGLDYRAYLLIRNGKHDRILDHTWSPDTVKGTGSEGDVSFHHCELLWHNLRNSTEMMSGSVFLSGWMFGVLRLADKHARWLKSGRWSAGSLDGAAFGYMSCLLTPYTCTHNNNQNSKSESADLRQAMIKNPSNLFETVHVSLLFDEIYRKCTWEKKEL